MNFIGRRKKRDRDVINRQAREYLQELLGREFGDGDLYHVLQDTTILGDVASNLMGAAPKPNDSRRRPSSVSQSTFLAVENITKFRKAATHKGVPAECLFDTDDLHDRRNFHRVVECILNLRDITEGGVSPRSPRADSGDPLESTGSVPEIKLSTDGSDTTLGSSTDIESPHVESGKQTHRLFGRRADSDAPKKRPKKEILAGALHEKELTTRRNNVLERELAEARSDLQDLVTKMQEEMDRVRENRSDEAEAREALVAEIERLREVNVDKEKKKASRSSSRPTSALGVSVDDNDGSVEVRQKLFGLVEESRDAQEQAEGSAAALRKELKVLEAELSSLKDEMGEKEEERALACERQVQLQAALSTAEEALKDAAKKLEKEQLLRKDVDQSLVRETEARDAADSKRREAARELRKHNLELISAKTSQKEAEERADREAERRVQSNAQLKQQIEELGEALKAAQKATATAAAAAATATATPTEASSSSSDRSTQREVEKLERNLEEEKSALKEARAENSALEEKLTKEKAERATAEEERERLESKVEKLERRSRIGDRRPSDATAGDSKKVRELEDEKATLERTVRDLERKLKRAEASLEDAEKVTVAVVPAPNDRRARVGSMSVASASGSAPAIITGGDDPLNYEKIHWSDLEIVRELDKGAFASIHEALRCGERVAVKKFNAQTLTKENKEEVENEIRIMTSLHSGFIVQIYGAHLSPPNMCVVMEYCARGSLFNLLDDESTEIAWDLKWQLIRDVALGLHYFHSKGYLHRDLKSGNVLVTEDWHAKLCDFGMSCKMSDAEGDADSGGPDFTGGTARWTAPEVITGDGKYTTKADVYSFGIIAWEIAHRKIPFVEESGLEIASVVQRGQRPAIHKDTPEDARHLIEWCWNQAPDRRPTFTQVVKWMTRKGLLENKMAKAKDAVGKADELQAELNIQNQLRDRMEQRSSEMEKEMQKLEQKVFGMERSQRDGSHADRRTLDEKDRKIERLEAQVKDEARRTEKYKKDLDEVEKKQKKALKKLESDMRSKEAEAESKVADANRTMKMDQKKMERLKEALDAAEKELAGKGSDGAGGVSTTRSGTYGRATRTTYERTASTTARTGKYSTLRG
eukprot:TRINITY_DN5339_c0_g1_i1.p1 TRINITY_DN5339_c0_g1~~TRINITY_DN5339_c0_g1_i1.p1  ORF type:complete len:1110 (+),score=378.59 TRINITY_DN5339_c0_g1_i1:184-3513(+)